MPPANFLFRNPRRVLRFFLKTVVSPRAASWLPDGWPRAEEMLWTFSVPFGQSGLIFVGNVIGTVVGTVTALPCVFGKGRLP